MLNCGLCGNFLEKVDETHIDYSVIFPSKILVQIHLSRAQRHKEPTLGVRFIECGGHFGKRKSLIFSPPLTSPLWCSFSALSSFPSSYILFNYLN